jgi:hypothetical protein
VGVQPLWVVIKGGPHTGAHLQLLSNYFVGFSVTWTGSLLGLLYGALSGGAIGWSFGRSHLQSSRQFAAKVA